MDIEQTSTESFDIIYKGELVGHVSSHYNMWLLSYKIDNQSSFEAFNTLGTTMKRVRALFGDDYETQ